MPRKTKNRRKTPRRSRRTAKREVVALRESVLQTALDITMHARNASYGDPLLDHGLAARLKEIFWNGFNNDFREKTLGRYTAHGEAIDRVLLKLARIATSPVTEPLKDCYVDGAAQLAIAYEVGHRTIKG